MSAVTLVYVPFGSLERPSLGLGLLKAALTRSDIACEVRYATFPFAERVGLEMYGKLSWVRDEMLGEWVFAGSAFPDFHPAEDYLDRALDSFYRPEDLRGREFGRRYLEFARDQASEFIREEALALVATGTRIVGVSSTFNQNCAMLALTRAIKELSPQTTTVCGGANCEGEMGVAMARNFPWLDFVVSGDAEVSFPRLCSLVLDGEVETTGDLPAGVISSRRVRAHLPVVGAKPVAPRSVQPSIDNVPIPDFEEYFDGLARYADRDCITPGLVVETARGCWWGAVHHCTFCGLNGGTMDFRSKSVGRVLEELHHLSTRYGLDRFLVADNILDQGYYRNLLPELAAMPDGKRYDLYLEIKANVTRAQLCALHAAGARWLVAGIESLHDGLLKLMDKGTTAWINLQVLKWSREIGIHMSWNMLAGLPGESDDWFAEMAELVPLITHLEPPNDVRSIRFDRFSPYQSRPEDYGLTLRPSWPYGFIFPLDDRELSQLVYFFEAEDRVPVRLNPFRRGRAMEETMPSMGGAGRNALQNAVREWVRSFRSEEPETLVAAEESDRTFITDTRKVAPAQRVVLEGVEHRVHRATHSALSAERVVSVVNADGGESVDEPAVCAALSDLVGRSLVVALGNKYLALATNGTPPPLPWENEDGFPGGWFVAPRPARYPQALEDYINRKMEEIRA